MFNIKPIADFFAREPVIKRLLVKYVIPFYLKLKGGKIRTDDYVIFVDHRDHKGVINFAHSFLHNNVNIEPYEVGIFSTLVTMHPEAIVFDIGANYGMYTLTAAVLRRQTDSISIVAVEPYQRVFDCLKKSVVYNKYDKLCIPVHAAVGSCHSDYCSIARHRQQSSFNFTLPLNSHDCPTEFEMSSDVIRMVTVDGLAEELGIMPKKVIIKIDIEGNEVHAVRGMKGILKACDSYVIFSEYSVASMNYSGNRPDELLEELFTLESDGIYEINSAAKSLVRLRESADLLSENRVLTNLLIVKNMDLSAFF